MGKLVLNSDEEQQKEAAIMSTVIAGEPAKAERVSKSKASYSREATRKPRVIRISKIPKSTNTYLIQSVNGDHGIETKEVAYMEAITVSKRFGIPINQN